MPEDGTELKDTKAMQSPSSTITGQIISEGLKAARYAESHLKRPMCPVCGQDTLNEIHGKVVCRSAICFGRVVQTCCID